MEVPVTRTRMPDLASVDFEKPAEIKAFLTSLLTTLSLEFQKRPVNTTAMPAQLYRSPNGTAYRMTISDAGVPAYTPVGTGDPS